MIVYLDTSALVKLYVKEAGTREVQRLIRESEAVVASWVAYAETRAAFARAVREKLTSPARHQERLAQFNQDWESVVRVELLPLVARNAGELAEIHGLRGFDAIHLASALWLRDKMGGSFGFAAFDQRLRSAAEQAGLRNLV